MFDIKKIVLKKSQKQPAVLQTKGYPALDMGHYFAGGGLFGYSSGLYYDFATGTEKNYTGGKYRIIGNKDVYEQVRQQIESLPQMKGLELRAFRMVMYDDAGTVISFAMAHRGSHSLLPMSPFCGDNTLISHQFYANDPSDLIKNLVRNGIRFPSGRVVALGNYILRDYIRE